MVVGDGGQSTMKNVPKSRPLFSILIPSRNRPELLRHVVDSVLAQESLFEIVIADNASNPSYNDFVASLGDVARRSVRSEVPLDVTENWNRALQAATGEYIVMLGDDDALTPGCLARLVVLIERFLRPDALYHMAFHYTYPKVIPGQEEGGFALISNAEAFNNQSEPYFLSHDQARRYGLQVLKFRHLFSFNSQHFVWRREFIESLADKGPFFQSPYPDYYSSAMTMISASRILVNPSPEVIIGISPKSFGFYFHQNDLAGGLAMLGNDGPSGDRAFSRSAEEDKAITMIGSQHYRSWLSAALVLCQRLGLHQSAAIDWRRYRRIQIIELVVNRGKDRLPRRKLADLLEPHLDTNERTLLQRLCWLERLSTKRPQYREIIRQFIHELPGIYARAEVSVQDIGPHATITDAFRWLNTCVAKYPGMPLVEALPKWAASKHKGFFDGLRRILRR